MDSLTSPRSADRNMASAQVARWDVRQEPKLTRLGCPKKVEFEDSGMVPSPLTSHPTTGDTSLDDFLEIIEVEVTVVISAGVKSAKELDIKATDVIALFKNMNYKVYMCVGITLNINILQQSVSTFDTGSVLNLNCTLFSTPQWRDCIRHIHIVPFRSAITVLFRSQARFCCTFHLVSYTYLYTFALWIIFLCYYSLEHRFSRDLPREFFRVTRTLRSLQKTDRSITLKRRCFQ